MSTNNNNVIELRHVAKFFRHDWTWKPKQVLFDIDFHVEAGESFGFVGPNGAGKTTTIKLLLDIIRPSSGQVLLLGGSPDRPATRRRVGFLPERPYFYDYLTAREILTFYARISDVPAKDITRRCDEMLALVGLADATNKRLRRFSKGMLQRLGLAQALVGDPELVILDEPMSGLDPIGRHAVRDVILALREKKKTVFFSSHILPDVEAICDRVAMIHQGQLRLVGSIHELLSRADRRESEVTLHRPIGKQLPPACQAFVLVTENVYRGVVGEAALQTTIAEAIQNGVEVVSVTPRRGHLEDEFLRGIAEAKS